MKTVIIVLTVVTACLAQRGSYAGRRGIGYPSIEVPTSTTTTASTTASTTSSTTTGAAVNNVLGDRFGGVTTPSTATTTLIMPLEANGDVDLVKRLNQLPADHQPFWLLNWRALNDHRSQPRSYSVPQNNFVDFASFQNRQNSF